MRIEHLRYLLKIDELHSISAAAQQLYLSQTTLSSILRSVEQELGFPIFCRTHQGVQTTAEGEEALSLMWDICCRFDEISKLSMSQPVSSRPVPIIVSPTINGVVAMPVNKLFLQKEPSGNLEFRSVSGDEVGSMLIKNDANIGITYKTKNAYTDYCAVASKYQIRVQNVFSDHLYLLVAKTHPLASRDTISCRELRGLDIALLSHFLSREDSIAYVKILGSGNRYASFLDVALIKQAVIERNMVALLAGISIQYNYPLVDDLVKAIFLTDTKEENAMDVCLIYRAKHNLRYQEKVALQCIEEYFDMLPPPSFSPEAATQT